jgi:hypothetical protein
VLEDVKATVFCVDLAVVSSLILAPVSWAVIHPVFSPVINVAKGIAGPRGERGILNGLSTSCHRGACLMRPVLCGIERTRHSEPGSRLGRRNYVRGSGNARRHGEGSRG